MLSMFKKALVAAVVVAGMASLSEAATITYTLSLNDNGQGVLTTGKFAIYAQASAGDNFGLASVAVDITNGVANNVGISGLLNQLPKATYSDTINGVNPDTVAGFTVLRSATNVNQLIGGGVDNTGSSVYGVNGFGQTNGDLGVIPDGFDTKSGVSPNANAAGAGFTAGKYLAKILVATGSFTAANPVNFGNTNGGSGGGVFLNDISGLGDGSNMQILSLAPSDIILVNQDLAAAATPEPASLGVLALGGLALLARRRKVA